jgi:hypothetical protein
VSLLRARSALAGRVRWDVAGLRDAPIRAAALAEVLHDVSGVRLAIADSITGRLLVEFQPRNTPPSLLI